MNRRGAEFKPYTIVWQGTEYDENGAVVGQYTETRYKARDGRWYSVRRFPDGRRQETFSVPGEGVFARGKDRLFFLSEASKEPQAVVSEEEVRRSPLFLRSEELHGLKTYVIKSGPGGRDEFHRAPELNYDWVKRVERGENGNILYTVEPVSIVMGDPAPSVFKPVDLPVDRSFHEKKEKMRQQQTPPK
ncbi:MAG TPA: hypothetical protein VF736_11135 [Pyrinomonadaceae bacterium]